MKSTKPLKSNTDLNCACESGKLYTACCKIYHDGLNNGISAPTAEALMRSRYTAYTLDLEAYLLNTWHPETRPASLNLTTFDRHIFWLGLQVKQFKTISENEATVEFIARFKDNSQNGKAERMREISQFLRIENAWFYVKALPN